MTTTRTLRRGLPLDPALFERATAGLTSAEIGAMVLLALAWWPTGELSRRPADLGRVLGIDPQAAKRMASRLRPHFEPSGSLGLLRAAHLRKAERRARAGRAGMSSRWGIPDPHSA